MLRSILGFAAVLGLATPAMAESMSGFYVNPEYNSVFSGEKYMGAMLDAHVGYENGAWYIQAGPALLNDTSDTLWGVSGKTGVSVPVDEKTDIYGELSFAKFDDSDTDVGVKLGFKSGF